MGAAFALQPRAVTSQKQRTLKELHLARQALIKDRTRALNRQKTLTLAILKRQTKARLTQLKGQLARLDEEIRTLLQSTPETARMTSILCSIPGLSQISAATLIIEMPELGTLSAKQTASLAGLAPMTRQSPPVARQGFYSGREKTPAGCALYARIGCRQAQSRYEAHL